MAGKSKSIKFRWKTPDMRDYRTLSAFNLREARQMVNMLVNNYASGCRLPRGTIVERAPKEDAS